MTLIEKTVSGLAAGLILLAALSGAASAYWGSGYVQLFDDKDFKDRAMTINVGTNIPDMHQAATDDGKNGFNDKASSAKYEIPPGWDVVLYDDVNYQKRVYVLKGTGETKDLSKASDKCSSLRWERR